MKARLVILVAVAVVLVAYYLLRPTNPSTGTPVVTGQNMSPEERRRIELMSKMLWELPLAGEEPPEPPELSIRMEVDPTEEKNRLFYHISEANGYYVEYFQIEFYYKPDENTTADDSPYARTEYINDYVKANETLVGCFEVVPAELGAVGGDIGTSDNWDAEIIYHGRARAENPDPLPLLSEVGKCRP